VSEWGVVAWARQGRRGFLMADLFHYAKYSGIAPDITEEEHGDICVFLEESMPNTPRIVQWRMETGRIYAKPGRFCQQFNEFLAPRKTYKTTLIQAACAYAQEIDPDIRIVLGRATTTMAELTLEGLKDNLARNPALREVFGPVQSRYSMWTGQRITRGDRNPGVKEPTVDTTGLGQSQTGQHPDWVILDDLVHEGNFESVKEMYAARRMVDSYDAILESWGSLLLTGTRWGDNDVSGYIQERDQRLIDAGKTPKFRHLILQAYADDGKPRFPNALPAAFLERQRDIIDPKMFAAWYLNHTRAAGEDIFTLAYIQWFEGEHQPGPYPVLTLDGADPLRARFGANFPLFTVLLVDPAPTVGPKSDFTGIVVVGFDARTPCNWWVLYADEVKKLPTDRLDLILYLCRTYDPAIVALENADMEASLLQHRLEAMGLRGKVVRFDPRADRKRITTSDLTPRGRTAKEAQIEALEPTLRARRIFFAKGTTMPLVRRLQAYPYVDHDDVLDAFSMAQVYEQSARTETFGAIAPQGVRVFRAPDGAYVAQARASGRTMRGRGPSAEAAQGSLLATLAMDLASRKRERREYELEGLEYGVPAPSHTLTQTPPVV
jgi:hypothetical protein